MQKLILVEDLSTEIIYRIPEDKPDKWRKYLEVDYFSDSGVGPPEWAEKIGPIVGRHY